MITLHTLLPRQKVQRCQSPDQLQPVGTSQTGLCVNSTLTFSLSLIPNTSNCFQPASSKCEHVCAHACVHACVCLFGGWGWAQCSMTNLCILILYFDVFSLSLSLSLFFSFLKLEYERYATRAHLRERRSVLADKHNNRPVDIRNKSFDLSNSTHSLMMRGRY